MNLLEYLDIQTIAVKKQQVVLKLTVSDKHKQPYGLLHGGMNGILAETAASMGANANLPADQVAVGTQLNTNHLRSVNAGDLFVEAYPIKIGRTLQIWEAKTYQNKSDNITSISTVTLLAQPKPH